MIHPPDDSFFGMRFDREPPESRPRRGLSRRQFLTRTALAGASVAAANLWWPLLERGVFAAPTELPDISQFLGQDQTAELLKIALSKGADFAEVYGEYTINTQFSVDEQKLKTAEYGVLQGVGVRVIVGDQTGYAYADEFDMAVLREAASVAAAIASGSTGGTPRPFQVSKAQSPFVLKAPAPLNATEEQRIDLARRADQAARAHDKRIAQVNALMQDTARSMLVANSEGLWVTDRQFVSRLVCAPVAIDGSNRQSAFAVSGGQVEADHFEKVRTPEMVGKEAAIDAIDLLTAVEPRGGTYPVVIAPGWGGVLVHECFGHSLEGDGIRKKTSIRAFQLDKQVCSDICNIYDDGTFPHSRGAFKVDDEGTPSRKNLVVEKGILKGYLWDRLNGKLAGYESTGNGRRNSYRDFPIPRMTTTYIAPGQEDPESLIGSVQEGLYCKRMGGGSVNPADGNFSFVVRVGYQIENGQLTHCVKGATLTGNAAEAMMKVVGLGDDFAVEIGTGTCGKDGQFKPIGVGQPTVKFSEMTVGGTRS